jgi:radical SAM protein with 4Fe4S-binding SPASM domain
MANYREAGPRYIIWELTKETNQGGLLSRPSKAPSGKDMSINEAVRFIDSVSKAYRTTIIFSGGEPLTKPEVFDLAEFALSKGQKVILNTNGAYVDSDAVQRCVEARMKGVQVGLDGSSARAHDNFRQVPGAFQEAIKAIDLLKLAAVKFEVYTLVSRQNASEIPKITTLAQKLGAWGHTFMFVLPTGPYAHMKDHVLSLEDYHYWLNWIFERKYKTRINLKVVCSPQFNRIVLQRGNELPDSVNPLKSKKAMDALGPGCPGGRTTCYVASNGDVYPCEHSNQIAGNVKKTSFKDIWVKSPVLNDFRNSDKLQDVCGACEYKIPCGGCRAWAEYETGNYLGTDPVCTIDLPIPELATDDPVL